MPTNFIAFAILGTAMVSMFYRFRGNDIYSVVFFSVIIAGIIVASYATAWQTKRLSLGLVISGGLYYFISLSAFWVLAKTSCVTLKKAGVYLYMNGQMTMNGFFFQSAELAVDIVGLTLLSYFFLNFISRKGI